MPTYQYRCLSCERQFDLRQSFNDQPVADCPECKGVARRVFCPVPIVFKGPGFYVTDSRGGSEGRSEATASAKRATDSGGSD